MRCENKIATNGIYNHLKHKRKHKIAWDDGCSLHRSGNSLNEKKNQRVTLYKCTRCIREAYEDYES